MPNTDKLSEITAWCQNHITGEETFRSGTLAESFLDRLFEAFDQPGSLEVGGHPEFRIRKEKEDGEGTAFADYVWKFSARCFNTRWTMTNATRSARTSTWNPIKSIRWQKHVLFPRVTSAR